MGPVLGFIGAIFVGAAAGASAGYILAVNIARFALLSLASKFLAPKIDLQQTARDKMFTVKSAIQPQAFVYGQDMLSGPLIFANVSGSDNEYLHRLVALTGREIDDVVAFRIDDTDLVVGTDLSTRNSDVTASKFADVMTIATELGTDTQTVLSQLNTDFPTLWTSAHRARGWSLLYVRCEIVTDSEAYEKGAPQNLRALVKGHKVYDPRLDDLQTTLTPPGSGTHRLADSTTWAWSENPALCLADWLMWDQVGMSEESDRIDWEMVATAADICDQTEAVPAPTTTQKRYTCNFTFFADQERGQIKSLLESAMLGRCIFSQGQWRMWAGAALTPTVTLTENNLSGGVTCEASTSGKERYNTVRGKFVDPTRDYHAAAYPEQTDASYVVDDNNEVKYKTVDFNTCNNSYECQRNAQVVNRQSRNQNILRWEGNWSCFRIQCGDAVDVTVAELGFAAKQFLVTEWSLKQDGSGVDLTLVEDNDIWSGFSYTTRSATGELIPPAELPPETTSTESGLFFLGFGPAGSNSSYDNIAASPPSGVTAGDHLYCVYGLSSTPTGWTQSQYSALNFSLLQRTATGDASDTIAASSCGVLSQIFAFKHDASDYRRLGVSYIYDWDFPHTFNFESQTINSATADDLAGRYIIYGANKITTDPEFILVGDVEMTETAQRVTTSSVEMIGYRNQLASGETCAEITREDNGWNYGNREATHACITSGFVITYVPVDAPKITTREIRVHLDNGVGSQGKAGIGLDDEGFLKYYIGDQIIEPSDGADYDDVWNLGYEDEWITPANFGETWHVKFNVTPDDTYVYPSVSLDTWYEISVNRSVYLRNWTDDSTYNRTLAISLSKDAGVTTYLTSYIYLSATRQLHLAPADAAQAVTVDNITLQPHVTTADAAMGMTVDNITLTDVTGP